LFLEGILIKEIMTKEKDMKFTNWFHYFWKVSLCGLASKIAQILLEVALLYIIAVNWRKSSK